MWEDSAGGENFLQNCLLPLSSVTISKPPFQGYAIFSLCKTPLPPPPPSNEVILYTLLQNTLSLHAKTRCYYPPPLSKEFLITFLSGIHPPHLSGMVAILSGIHPPPFKGMVPFLSGIHPPLFQRIETLSLWNTPPTFSKD
jgi:hypothetical protein